MKLLKKLFPTLLATLMIAALCVPALAQTTSIALDGEVYTDHMQSFNIRGNYTLFERLGEKWRLREWGVPYNDFRSAEPGAIGTTFWIAFIKDGGETYVRLRFNDGNLYGPADSAGEAARVEELFGLAEKYDETSGW